MLSETDDELSVCLHQALKGRRYLIVLDDVWDVKPWDDTSRFFPDENNGSRIIVTTRESSVADYTGSGRSHHRMNLLKDDESWNLLRQKAKASQDFWEQVSKNISSTEVDKGAFPEDYEIRSSKLINLLVAEGLVRPLSGKSLKGAADMHLKALVDRNLIFVRQQGIDGNAKSYGICTTS
ncbi:UNVERIFIED_CONTAM: putative late blight resistance proteinR1A-3 [Sesamum calycinum]|uniref:Late blight resistance proteinR1A-3 n=1 Tax=Sesamum calycinum TaxID=2727403 RepID=A0AAW2PNS7_9LAMI